jgi:hypothetical protein
MCLVTQQSLCRVIGSAVVPAGSHKLLTTQSRHQSHAYMRFTVEKGQ